MEHVFAPELEEEELTMCSIDRPKQWLEEHRVRAAQRNAFKKQRISQESTNKALSGLLCYGFMQSNTKYEGFENEGECGPIYRGSHKWNRILKSVYMGCFFRSVMDVSYVSSTKIFNDTC